MVASVTNHTADFILWELPLAHGLQFQALAIELRSEGRIYCNAAASVAEERAEARRRFDAIAGGVIP